MLHCARVRQLRVIYRACVPPDVHPICADFFAEMGVRDPIIRGQLGAVFAEVA